MARDKQRTILMIPMATYNKAELAGARTSWESLSSYTTSPFPYSTTQTDPRMEEAAHLEGYAFLLVSNA